MNIIRQHGSCFWTNRISHMSTLSLAILIKMSLAISFTEHEPNFEQLTVLAETIKTVKKESI